MNHPAGETLAPWLQQQALDLLRQRGHAWLLQGPSGLGQAALGLAMVRAWLCDQPDAGGLACGQCESCHAIDVHAHTDLRVLMPETAMLESGWPLDEKAQKEIDDKKRKPSKEIRIEAMREAVEFAQRTSGRGRGKAVLIYPAERMNTVTANALLKTLEEPAGDVRFVLASEGAHLLLPTIRSRCIVHTMRWPATEEALAWLDSRSLPATEASVLLRAAGGRPDDALALARAGLPASRWKQLPRAAHQGDTSLFATLSPSQAIHILQKICHDALCLKAGGPCSFFSPEDFPPSHELPDWKSLSHWGKALTTAMRSAEHPYSPSLFIEDLLTQASLTLHVPRKKPSAARNPFV